MKSEYDGTAKVFKALSDPNRLMIIELLRNGEKCACRLLEDMRISQSTLSHHMKILGASGVVNCRRDGKWMYYSLRKKGCETVYNLLKEIIESAQLIGINDQCACD